MWTEIFHGAYLPSEAHAGTPPRAPWILVNQLEFRISGDSKFKERGESANITQKTH